MYCLVLRESFSHESALMAGLFFENYIEEGNERNISHEMFSDVPKENLLNSRMRKHLVKPRRSRCESYIS
jgi:hypothetical protein